MSITSTIRRFFASITIKLFIWFWLIAIISIASTRFISQQLSNEAFNKAAVQTATFNELKQLGRVQKHIKHYKVDSITSLKNSPLQKLSKRPINIWIKSINQADAQSLFLLPGKHQQAIEQYVNNHQLDKPETHLFFHTRLIGPRTITIENKQYQVFISKKRHRHNFGQLMQQLPTWARFGIPAFISFVLCLLLAKSFSRPIRTMQHAASNIGNGDFSTRVNKVSERGDELGQLASSFNLMAEQLELNQSAQRRLLGDVSHELRSPMARLQMALGLAQQEATTEQAREKYLQRCQIEIERLEKMVADVLSLSRLENTLQGLEIEKIDINSLLTNIVSDEQFTADNKAITITISSDQDIAINADRALITSAISNVLSNAVKYSPDNSGIIVSVSKKQQRLMLTIIDSGHGVPEEALPKLFSPFYRVNLARDRKTGGTGLGLAIAKQAIIAHQGTITAKNIIDSQNNENTLSVAGLSVTIELPCL